VTDSVIDRAADLEARLLGVLRTATATPTVEFDGAPTRLTGGFWAELIAFRLDGAPDGWRGALVARVMPDPDTAAKETAIQAEVAAQGFPTPVVHLSGGPGDGLGRAFMVMDRAHGASLLGGLDGIGAIKALPRLARRLPDTLARTMAALHRIDPTPVQAHLRAAGVEAHGMAELVAGLEATATRLGRDDLATAARWLAHHRPASAPEVVCHGDLHPFNVLVDDDGTVTVLDWSAAIVAAAAYDVAFTSVVLAEPPLAVPRPLVPVVRAAGRFLARRFLRAYARHGGCDIDPASLRWHQGVFCLRALAEVAGWVTSGHVDQRWGHPWLVSGPAFAARLASLTGEPVRAR
jgi:aminoglycoside phosphotransferase (APT) family kinase protein